MASPMPVVAVPVGQHVTRCKKRLCDVEARSAGAPWAAPGCHLVRGRAGARGGGCLVVTPDAPAGDPYRITAGMTPVVRMLITSSSGSWILTGAEPRLEASEVSKVWIGRFSRLKVARNSPMTDP